METAFFLLIALAIAFLAGYVGDKRKIGFGWAFFLTFLCWPVGLIMTFCSKKKSEDLKFTEER
jgi:hypothetical protein